MFHYDELPEVQSIFWSAPKSYLGNLLDKYGSYFDVHLLWQVIRGDTSATVTTGPNVVLCGSNGMRIGYGDQHFIAESKGLIQVRINETGWYKYGQSNQLTEEARGNAVTRVQFMSVLSNVSAILIRGSFHTDQFESVFISGRLYTKSGTSTSDGQVEQSQVEKCHCPAGYKGNSCETCSFGFARTFDNHTVHDRIGKCHQCDCNGHARDCDVLNDKCGTCEHNTYGERCERCSVGFYGNAMHGTATDCQRCACPLLVDTNNFSPSCQLKELILDTNQLSNELLGGWDNHTEEYVCTQCPIGYIGDHCEM